MEIAVDRRSAPPEATPTEPLREAAVSDAAWDAFVASQPEGHLLQSAPWGALKARFGWQVERLALLRGERIVAGGQMLLRPLPLGLSALAYVPMGPLVDEEDEPARRAVIAGLERLARRRRAFCLTLEWPGPANPARAAVLSREGWRPAPHPMQYARTIRVDLAADEEAILSRFSSSTRHKVRAAERKGVTVRAGALADIEAYGRLASATAGRHEITLHDTAYYREAYRLFEPEGHVRLLLAEHEGELLAGIMVFTWGRHAYYMYGASGDSHRNLMPNYLLQWEGMRWARRQGCLDYDLCGVPDEPEDVLEREFSRRRDGLWGVYGFKRGFGGRLVTLGGAYDRVYSPPLYRLYHAAGALLERRLGETWHRRFRRG